MEMDRSGNWMKNLSKSSWPTDNCLSFPNLRKSETGHSRWLLPRSEASMLVRFHRGLRIGTERLRSRCRSHEVKGLDMKNMNATNHDASRHHTHQIKAK